MNEIVPQKKLGDFVLEDSVNKVLSIIKQKGEIYQECKIILEDGLVEPLSICLPKEGITLRFSCITQKLELIEMTFEKDKEHSIEYFYKKNLIFSTKNKEHIYYSNPDYSYITSAFGLSYEPQIIDNDNHILLPYVGISFIFSNKDRNPDPEEISQSSELEKMLLFSGNTLTESLGNENNSSNPLLLINFKAEKNTDGIFIHQLSVNGIFQLSEDTVNVNKDLNEKNENVLQIKIGDTLEEVLYKLKNPNYVHHFNNRNKEFDQTEDIGNDFYLNYYSMGFDLLIDGNKSENNVKRIIFHTNNPLDSNFGIYERCNFMIEMNENYFKRNSENLNNHQSNPNNSFRKMSDDYQDKQNESFQSEGENLSEAATDRFSFIQGVNQSTKQKETKGQKKKKNKVHSESEEEIKMPEEVATSISLVKEKTNINILGNITVYPWSDFKEILTKIPRNSYNLYQKRNNKINRVYKYYLFDGIIFEVMENGMISTVIISK